MNEWHSRKIRPKKFKHKNPPGIEKLGGPLAKDQPSKPPANQDNLSPPRPGALVRGFCLLGFKKLVLAFYLRYEQRHRKKIFLVFRCTEAIFLQKNGH